MGVIWAGEMGEVGEMGEMGPAMSAPTEAMSAPPEAMSAPTEAMSEPPEKSSTIGSEKLMAETVQNISAPRPCCWGFGGCCRADAREQFKFLQLRTR
jgi:hypothetical protein